MHFHDLPASSAKHHSATRLQRKTLPAFSKLNTSEPVVYKPHMVLGAPRNNDERKSLKSRHRRSVWLYFHSVDSANCVSYPLFTERCYMPSIMMPLIKSSQQPNEEVLLTPISQRKTLVQRSHTLHSVMELNLKLSQSIPGPLS